MAQRIPHPAKSHRTGAAGDSDKQRVMALVQQQEWLAARELCARLCQQRPDDPEAWFLLGAIHGQRQDFAQAVECGRRAVALRPDAAMAHYNLGIALHHLNDYISAVASFQEAIRLQPGLAEAHHDLGNAYQAAERLDEAIACYQKTLSLQPGLAAARFNLAQAYRLRGRITEAVAELRHGLMLDQTNVEARLRLAELLTQQRQLAEAAEHYRAALRMRPGQAEVHVNLGVILQKLQDIEGAIAQYRTALELQPDLAEAHFNLGNALKTLDRFTEAQACYERALEIDPEFALACNNLGVLLQEKNRLDEAIALFRRAMAINPALTEPWINLAKAAREQLRLADALEAVGHAIQIQPEAPEPHWDRALMWLTLGDFTHGWPEYELRWQGGAGLVQRNFNLPRWEGQPLAGKTILIYAEQGIGDELMFASCFPDVIQRAGHVIIDCAPRLAALFKRSFPQANIHGGAQNDDPGWLGDMPAVDFQIAAGSLPLHLRNSLADFPIHSGYLKPDPALLKRWAERYAQLGQGIKVGISWRGGHISQAHKRSTTLDQWQAILRTSGIQWINLQYGSPAQEINDVHEQFGITIHDWEDADPLTDLDNFAAQIAALDLVISVDNSTVHMTGALGVPVWVLQPYSADWRWLLEREDSHWYPSVRQIRQPARGNWASVLRNAEQQLVLYSASKRINS